MSNKYIMNSFSSIITTNFYEKYEFITDNIRTVLSPYSLVYIT